MTRRIGVSADRLRSQQRLHFGSNTNRRSIVREVERFDPERISRDQHSLPLRIPEYEAEHSAELAYHIGPMLAIEAKQDFSVGIRPKAMTSCLEITTQRSIIVDLTIEGDYALLLIADHRL